MSNTDHTHSQTNATMRTSSLAAIALAIVFCTSPRPAHAGGGWLAQCLNNDQNELSDAQCYLEYKTRLQREQSGTLKRIKQALEQPGPAGTDYRKALTLVKQSQAQWQASIATDCAIVSEVFGEGHALGFAEETCVIGHYRARNTQLETLLAEFLSN